MRLHGITFRHSLEERGIGIAGLHLTALGGLETTQVPLSNAATADDEDAREGAGGVRHAGVNQHNADSRENLQKSRQ
jgi:hypothetical protein